MRANINLNSRDTNRKTGNFRIEKSHLYREIASRETQRRSPKNCN